MGHEGWLDGINKAICLRVNLVLLLLVCINFSRGVCHTEIKPHSHNEHDTGGSHSDVSSDQARSQKHAFSRKHREELLEAFKSDDVRKLKYSHLGSTLEDFGVSVDKLVEISERVYLNDLANCQEQSRRKRDTEIEDRAEDDGFENDKVAFSWGHYVLGGLFAVYRQDQEGKPCQSLFRVAAMWLESMIYAVKKINNDTGILPNIHLGYEIRDDCSDHNKVLQAGLQFVDSMSANGSCEDTSRTVGVVGTGSSLTSATVAKLLALFEVPQVSYSASSPIFSNKQEYPYFLRTVGPDTYQARVMVDIAKTYQWNYVALIYSDDQYGSPGQQALIDLFMQESICVVLMHRVSDDLEDDMELTTVVEDIKADEKIEVRLLAEVR
ncbi:putative extracellular calcium-sensing receptor [Apostichopus japonicus]|uniref:Putative extracellular calcium-sensing receptor n=1 Tax=Stichopus japonicus TaxID=307972 RepID=A0A2G8LRQ2_STIJA|nr:putative extracellular calcium-sensing receptor [Apostichopus japonicus]